MLSQKNFLQKVWTSDQTYATVLFVLFVDTYSMEALTWDPESIIWQLEADLKIDLPQGTIDRLMMAIQIVTTDEFWNDPARFVHGCNVLSGSLFTPELFDPADPWEMAWGITEAMLLFPSERPLSSAVVTYVQMALKEYGITAPPPVLAVAGPAMDSVSTDFADDPEMFSALQRVQTENSASISETVSERFTELMQQLLSLPLRNGNTDKLVERIREQQSSGNRRSEASTAGP